MTQVFKKHAFHLFWISQSLTSILKNSDAIRIFVPNLVLVFTPPPFKYENFQNCKLKHFIQAS